MVDYQKTIELPEEDPPQTLEVQIRSAIYSACAYHWMTLLKVGHREVVLMSRDNFERLLHQAQAQQDPADV